MQSPEIKVELAGLMPWRITRHILAESLAIRAHQAHNPPCRAVGLHGFNPHRLVEERAGEDLAHDQWRPLIRHAVPLRGISVLVLALPEGRIHPARRRMSET